MSKKISIENRLYAFLLRKGLVFPQKEKDVDLFGKNAGANESDQELDLLSSEELLEKILSKPPNFRVSEGLEKDYFVKRKMMACYIINKSLDDHHFGKVKFEKLLHLCEYHVIKRNLGQKYIQQVAGPFDNSFTYQFFNQVSKSKWFYIQKKGSLEQIKPGVNNQKSKKTYNYFSKYELEQVAKLIDLFKSTSYEKPEIISTLYAVWNDRIIENQEVSDEAIKNDFLKWSIEKEKYKDRLDRALKWMKDEGLTPDGWGRKIQKL